MGYDYTEGDISTLRAKCGDGTLNAENTLSVVTFYWGGIYGGKSVVRRAGILLHEADTQEGYIMVLAGALMDLAVIILGAMEGKSVSRSLALVVR